MTEEQIAQMEKLADLHEKGILTDEEFNAQKKRLLESSSVGSDGSGSGVGGAAGTAGTNNNSGSSTIDANKIDMFFISNANKFPPEKIAFLKEKMATISDSRYMTVSSVELKDPMTMLLISIFLGELGVDRFMMGEIGMGILKLLTVGLCGILWLIDVIGISKKVREYNYNELMKVM